MMALEWRRLLKNDGVKINIVDPGLLATGLGGFGVDALRQIGAKEPIVGGRHVKALRRVRRISTMGEWSRWKGLCLGRLGIFRKLVIAL